MKRQQALKMLKKALPLVFKEGSNRLNAGNTLVYSPMNDRFIHFIKLSDHVLANAWVCESGVYFMES